MFLRDALMFRLQKWFQQPKEPMLLPILSGPARGLWLYSNQVVATRPILKSPGYSLLATICKKGWTIWDFESSTGFSTVLFSKLVGKDGLVVSFEKNKTTFQTTYESATLNGCNNILFIFSNPSQVKTAMTSTDLTIDQVYLETDFPLPHLIRMDLNEKTQVQFDQMRKMITDQKPLLLVEHVDSLGTYQLEKFSKECSYAIKPLNDSCYLLEPSL